MVEYAETAASLLQAVYAKEDLAEDLHTHPKLERRFKVAVGECFLVLKALGERFCRGGAMTNQKPGPALMNAEADDVSSAGRHPDAVFVPPLVGSEVGDRT